MSKKAEYNKLILMAIFVVVFLLGGYLLYQDKASKEREQKLLGCLYQVQEKYNALVDMVKPEEANNIDTAKTNLEILKNLQENKRKDEELCTKIWK